MPFEQRITRFCAEYPEAPRDLMLASRLLLRSARLLRHHIERALAPHTLDMGQYLVMSLLVADGGQPTMPSELGVAIDATRTQMTRLIDGLEARGLVQRKTSTQDRRSLELTLTAEGRALLERAAPAQDHFAAPRVRDTIPDDWDDLTEPPEPTQPDASNAAPPPADLPDPALAEPAPEPPPPPIHLAPEPPSVTGPDAATRAFLEALGAGHMAIPDADMVAAMTRLGQAMRSMIEGLREVLMTRASIKQELSLGQTVISAGGNNPLKFSVSPGQAVEAMVFPTAPGWLPADVAATQALDDLKAHEVAMLTGIEAALKDLLRKFDPKTLESRLTAGGGIGGFIKGRKARYWEIYEAHYAEIADQAENDFQDLFAHEFARAYRKQLERLK